MRLMMRRTQLIVLILLTPFLVQCTEGESGSGNLLGLESGPTPLVSLDNGVQIAATFLDAWQVQDYNTMYGLISPNAQDAYTEEEFTQLYQGMWEELRMQELSWERGNSLLQGTTAVINYDVMFQSFVLGEFEDANRTMRLIPTEEGMRIAWSRMDVFEGWAGGARLQVERFLASRGNIYDVNGRALADQNGVALSLYVTKQGMASVDQCLRQLVTVLGRDYQDLEQQFLGYNNDTLFLVGEIDQETYQRQGQALDSACRPDISERSTRRYFAGAAPHTVGYVGRIPVEESTDYDSQGYPADALIGLAGIERAWERELRGNIGNRLTLFSLTEERLRVITEKEATPGESVYLTLNRDLQQGIQQAFAEAYSNAGPTWSPTSPGAAAVIMDVRTGAIRGIASYPSFDPSVFNPDTQYYNPGTLIQQYYSDPRSPLLNRATQGGYPLGSVFKLVSSIAGANTGLFPFDRTNNCTGTWDGTPYGDQVRTDWYREGHGIMDGRGAIINSCNPYYWQMSVALNTTDPFLLPNYARMFGFGSPTGIRGVSEATGYISDPDLALQRDGHVWGQIDAGNMIIGQGNMTVTPIQVAGMIAPIANGGKLLTPYLVERVGIIGEEPSYVAQPEYEQLPLDPEVLAITRQAMCDVTTQGTAYFMFGDWYNYHNNAVTVCGKTGTAQSSETRPPHAWFAAFAPAQDPEIAVAVIVENSCEGSEVAAPIVRRLVEIYYGLPAYGWPQLWQGACSEIVIQ